MRRARLKEEARETGSRRPAKQICEVDSALIECAGWGVVGADSELGRVRPAERNLLVVDYGARWSAGGTSPCGSHGQIDEQCEEVLGRADVHLARTANVWIIRVGARSGIPLVHADRGRATTHSKRGENQNIPRRVHAAKDSLAGTAGNRDILLEKPDADIGVTIDSETLCAEYKDAISALVSWTCVRSGVAVSEGILVRRGTGCKGH